MNEGHPGTGALHYTVQSFSEMIHVLSEPSHGAVYLPHRAFASSKENATMAICSHPNRGIMQGNWQYKFGLFNPNSLRLAVVSNQHRMQLESQDLFIFCSCVALGSMIKWAQLTTGAWATRHKGGSLLTVNIAEAGFNLLA